ncbi:transmembrane protein 214-like protein [Tanacetum coccineum]|uniref:Transmembrane protein 214-like protein n=1 Tax=Tanacetum coccineum TaxID=301880 RepID=A0ABQ5B3F0_9ASTR
MDSSTKIMISVSMAVDYVASYEGQDDIQLMRFADYFGRAFSGVPASQFPWVKLFRESPIAKVADNPVSHISEAVYKTSVDWINKRSPEALRAFFLWSLDSILADLANQQGVTKGSKKGAQTTSSKSQVGLFVVLAMVLRRKPDVLISALPTLNETQKFQGQDKLPFIAWMVAQASQGELAVGLHLWSHLILPIIGTKAGSNPQTRDLILQSVERILSAQKAQTILVNGAVRKGERLLPPSALDLLLRATFPSSSARVKATERFEAVYPTLKKVALAGSTGSKAMKQVSQQILTISLKASGEGVPELANEASSIFIWCLTQNPDCCKQWEKLYLDDLEASVVVLRKLAEQWKVLSLNQSSLKALTETLRSFKKKNDKAVTDGEKSALYKEADKYCKVLLGRVSRGWGCMKATGFLILALGVGLAFLPVSTLDFESLDWNKLYAMVNIQQFV